MNKGKRIVGKDQKRRLTEIIVGYAAKNKFTAAEIKKAARKAARHMSRNAILAEDSIKTLR